MEFRFGLETLALLLGALAVLLAAGYAALRHPLRASEAQLRQIINRVPALIAYVDAQQRYVYVNQRYQQAFAPQQADLTGCSVQQVLGPQRYAAASPMIRLVLQGQEQRYEVQPFSGVWHLIHYLPTHDAQGAVTGYYVLGTDISHIKNHEVELDRVAHCDALTGLPNRRLLFDRLRQALLRADRSGKRCAICFLDLDGFKSINDRLGHSVGDQVLVAMACNLAEVLRGGDTLARLGGDEFVLLLSELDSVDECLLILQRMLEVARRPVSVDGQSLCLSASIGVCFYPTDSADPDLLLRRADMAMYRAKQAGKNAYHLFAPDSCA